MIVNRKIIKEQNLKKLFSIETHFHKNLSQKSYQWGTQLNKNKAQKH